MRVVLKRIEYTPHGVYGLLSIDEEAPFAVTLERPWLNNTPRISCIPVGTYRCKRVKSPTFGDTFEILGVEGRSALLFHWGNFVRNSRGCVLVAEKFKDIDGDGIKDIAESKVPGKGFLEFLALTHGVDEFDLEVVDG